MWGFFNYLDLSRAPCFFWIQRFYRSFQQATKFSVPRPSQPPICRSRCWKWEWWAMDVVLCELSESKGISQGAYTCRLTRSSADVMPSLRAVSLWQEQDNVCAEHLYRWNFSSNATNASGQPLMFTLEGIGITLKIRSGFQNSAVGLPRGPSLPLEPPLSRWLRKNKIAHSIANVARYYPTTWRLFFSQTLWSHRVFRADVHLANRSTKCSNKRSSWLFLISWNND